MDGEIEDLRRRICDGNITRDTLRCRVAGLEDELERVRGSMNAQDERERHAGEKCGVSYDEHGCDWPDRVADVIQSLRARIASAIQSADAISIALGFVQYDDASERLREWSELLGPREADGMADVDSAVSGLLDVLMEGEKRDA